MYLISNLSLVNVRTSQYMFFDTNKGANFGFSIISNRPKYTVQLFHLVILQSELLIIPGYPRLSLASIAIHTVAERMHCVKIWLIW